MPNDPIAIHDPAALGKLLRQVRKEMSLTQAEAAGICNVGVRLIVELEQGKQTAHIGKIFQVLKGYGLVLSASKRKISRGMA